MQYRQFIAISDTPGDRNLEKVLPEIENRFGEFERIDSQLARRERLFDEYNDRDYSEILQFLADQGVSFSPERLSGISVLRSVDVVLSNEELNAVPLFECQFPRIGDKNTLAPAHRCAICNHKLYENPANSLQLQTAFDTHVAKHFGIVYVSDAGRSRAVRSELRGAEFTPWQVGDRTFFALTPRSELKNVVFHSDEAIGFSGNCSCGWGNFSAYFGPTRYNRSEWSGEDIVWTPHSPYLYYLSHRAIEFFQSLDSQVDVLSPVLLV
jgi:hypothetical protein